MGWKKKSSKRIEGKETKTFSNFKRKAGWKCEKQNTWTIRSYDKRNWRHGIGTIF